MSAKGEDSDTEKLIKDTAKKVFFKEGRFNATTQEIADAAGVNRTLINYYFRSRDNLFNLVFEDAQKKEDERIHALVFSDMPLKRKIEMFLDEFFTQAKEYPYLEIYMVTQMNQGSCYEDAEAMSRLLDKMYLEIAIEMDKGNVARMRPEQFMLNMISLTSFPVSMRPLLEQSMGFSTEQFDKLLEERKEIILNMLFIN
ncbi:TetR family transcriptional regulator [Flavobacterium cyanobacteriorum]|uniref:TetR family transcriptional regulator n=1 Tax=Flavobacterium cyanobacteriorum TaxID=2022802 RepID=A0A255ZBM3_9FLAO|nr:TetR/AcrR family transcriptional regulator [Flavobacterium cyanobacteriorum]OYQ38275.1 TetR family transcriptional regulator [Flavobacterium cyanobacteriorum]